MLSSIKISGLNTAASARSFNSTSHFLPRTHSWQILQRPRFDFVFSSHWLAMATASKAASPTDPGNTGGKNYIATQSTFVAIAALLVFARVYVRTFIVKKFGLDDAVIVLALVSVIFTNINRKLIGIRFSLLSSVWWLASQSTMFHYTSPGTSQQKTKHFTTSFQL